MYKKHTWDIFMIGLTVPKLRHQCGPPGSVHMIGQVFFLGWLGGETFAKCQLLDTVWNGCQNLHDLNALHNLDV